MTSRKLKELRLREDHGALITRIRRGDGDYIPHGSLKLEPGDLIRVLGPRERMPEVTAFFGDSYKAISEVDFVTFSVGLALGLLVGSVKIPSPGTSPSPWGSRAARWSWRWSWGPSAGPAGWCGRSPTGRT